MARYPRAAAVYDAAKLFCERCLLSDGSLLGDESLWTAENLRRLHDAFVKDPDEGDRSFTDKFRDQIAKAGNDAVARLAAEVVAVHFLFPSNVGSDRKKALVAEVAGWGGGTLPARVPQLIRQVLDFIRYDSKTLHYNSESCCVVVGFFTPSA